MVSALALYRARVVPQARRELRGWREVAAAIPDSGPRSDALAAIAEKGLNVEATAVFAILAPRRTRPAAIRAMVALRVAIDYLDTLEEQPAADPLRDGLRLHGALAAGTASGADRRRLLPLDRRPHRPPRRPDRPRGGRRRGRPQLPDLLPERRGGGEPLDLIARLARTGLEELRHRHRHAAILAGVAGFYLSAAAADTPHARPIRRRLLRSAGPAVRPIVAVMRRRR